MRGGVESFTGHFEAHPGDGFRGRFIIQSSMIGVYLALALNDVLRSAQLVTSCLPTRESTQTSEIKLHAEIDGNAGLRRIFSKFFTLGQVIETVRGGGIFQPAIDEAIKKLQAGDWVRPGLGPKPAEMIG